MPNRVSAEQGFADLKRVFGDARNLTVSILNVDCPKRNSLLDGAVSYFGSKLSLMT